MSFSRVSSVPARRCPGEYDEPPGLVERPLLADLVRGMLTVDASKRLSVTQARAHRWLAEPEPAWEMEVKEAIAEISARVSTAKITVLPFISKKIQDEEQQANALTAEVSGGDAQPAPGRPRATCAADEASAGLGGLASTFAKALGGPAQGRSLSGDLRKLGAAKGPTDATGGRSRRATLPQGEESAAVERRRGPKVTRSSPQLIHGDGRPNAGADGCCAQ